MKLSPLQQVSGAHEDGIWAAAWVPPSSTHPEGLLFTGSVDECIKLWRIEDGLKEVRKTDGQALGVVSVATDPTGRLVATSSMDSTVRVYNVESNSLVKNLEIPPSETWGLAFDPTGKRFACAGGSSGQVKLWETEMFQQEAPCEMPKREGGLGQSDKKAAEGRFVLAVAFSANGRHLAASTMDGTVAVFDASSGRLVHSLEGHAMPVRALAWSPTEPRLLFTACDDCHARIYDAESGTLMAALSGHSSWVLTLSLSPDGTALATGSSDRTVRLWDLNTRSCAQVVSGHTDQVWGVAFRPSPPQGSEGASSRGRLATVSDDRSIALYDYT